MVLDNLFNLAWAKVIRDVNARSTIILKSTQLLANADDLDIMGNVQSTFIHIAQA